MPAAVGETRLAYELQGDQLVLNSSEIVEPLPKSYIGREEK